MKTMKATLSVKLHKKQYTDNDNLSYIINNHDFQKKNNIESNRINKNGINNKI